jgi:hypothetical protein
MGVEKKNLHRNNDVICILTYIFITFVNMDGLTYIDCMKVKGNKVGKMVNIFIITIVIIICSSFAPHGA